MKKFFEHIANTHRKDSKESAKRFYGGLGFICSIVFVGIWAHDLIAELMITSATMIIGDTISKTIKK